MQWNKRNCLIVLGIGLPAAIFFTVMSDIGVINDITKIVCCIGSGITLGLRFPILEDKNNGK